MQKIKCLICNKKNAQIDEVYGVLPCAGCQKHQEELVHPAKQVEFTTEDIKDGRRSSFTDIHGKHRSGVLSKEYIERWGTKGLKESGYTEKEIKSAKYVWKNGDDAYYNDNN